MTLELQLCSQEQLLHLCLDLIFFHLCFSNALTIVPLSPESSISPSLLVSFHHLTNMLQPFPPYILKNSLDLTSFPISHYISLPCLIRESRKMCWYPSSLFCFLPSLLNHHQSGCSVMATSYLHIAKSNGQFPVFTFFYSSAIFDWIDHPPS